MSSTIRAVCGSSSDSSMPDLPRLRELERRAEQLALSACRSGLRACPGSGLPCCLVSSGLGSNRSIWLGPPCWNRQMTAFALRRVVRRLRRQRVARGADAGAPRRRAGAPAPASRGRRRSGRGTRGGCSAKSRHGPSRRTSLDVQERVARQQHLAQVGPGPLVGVLVLRVDLALLRRGIVSHAARFVRRAAGGRRRAGTPASSASLASSPASRVKPPGERLGPGAGELRVEQRERLQRHGRGRPLAAGADDRRARRTAAGT